MKRVFLVISSSRLALAREPGRPICARVRFWLVKTFNLVARDAQGEIYTVRYEAVNAMLLNEFLKEHRKVQEQADTIAGVKSTVAQQQGKFQSKVAEQQKQIEALESGLQRVSAQIEATKRTAGGR
jgi:hypothetical protein